MSGFWRSKLEVDGPSPDPVLDGVLQNYDPKEIAGLYSYRGLDNVAYYALSADWQSYWNNTGVGQDCRDNHRPMRRLIRDSLRYWVEEMHVDGFRFDEGSVLHRGAESVEPFGVVEELARGKLTDQGWQERAGTLGIANLRLSVT